MKKYFFVLSALVLALLISFYISNSIFIAGTPKFNPNYLADLQSQFSKGLKYINLALTNFTKKKDVAVKPTPTANPFVFKSITPTIMVAPTGIADSLFKSFTTGVSAYENEGTTIFRFDEKVQFKVGKIEVNGKQYEIIELMSNQ